MGVVAVCGDKRKCPLSDAFGKVGHVSQRAEKHRYHDDGFAAGIGHQIEFIFHKMFPLCGADTSHDSRAGGPSLPALHPRSPSLKAAPHEA